MPPGRSGSPLRMRATRTCSRPADRPIPQRQESQWAHVVTPHSAQPSRASNSAISSSQRHVAAARWAASAQISRSSAPAISASRPLALTASVSTSEVSQRIEHVCSVLLACTPDGLNRRSPGRSIRLSPRMILPAESSSCGGPAIARRSWGKPVAELREPVAELREPVAELREPVSRRTAPGRFLGTDGPRIAAARGLRAGRQSGVNAHGSQQRTPDFVAAACHSWGPLRSEGRGKPEYRLFISRSQSPRRRSDSRSPQGVRRSLAERPPYARPEPAEQNESSPTHTQQPDSGAPYARRQGAPMTTLSEGQLDRTPPAKQSEQANNEPEQHLPDPATANQPPEQCDKGHTSFLTAARPR